MTTGPIKYSSKSPQLKKNKKKRVSQDAGPGSPSRTLYSGMSGASKKAADQAAYRYKKKKQKLRSPKK